MKCHRLFPKAEFLTQLIAELSFGESEARAALIDRPCSARASLGVRSAKRLLFRYLCTSLRQTPLPAAAAVPFVIWHALHWNQLPVPFPRWLSQTAAGLVVSPCCLFSPRWHSHRYLTARTALYRCPHLPQQLPNPVLSAVAKLFPNTGGRRRFFSSCKSELSLGGALSMPADLERLSIFHRGRGEFSLRGWTIFKLTHFASEHCSLLLHWGPFMTRNKFFSPQ